MKQFNVIPVEHKYNIADFNSGADQGVIKMLDLSNDTIYTELEHNACTIALLVTHIALLLWTLFSCSVVSMMVSYIYFVSDQRLCFTHQ